MKKKPRSINVQAELLPDGTPSPRLKAFLKDALAEMQRNAVDHKQPPWKAFPEYDRYSMGWRMGPGEDYWHAFHAWMRERSGTDFDAFVAENPEPENWKGFYDRFNTKA